MTRSGCRLIPTKLGLLYSQREGKSLVLVGVTFHPPMSIVYLGVALLSRQTWRKNVDVKVRKAHNLLWACRRAYGTTWGLRPKVAHWLYVSIITQSITFTPLVWWPGWCQEKTKQTTKTFMLRDKGSDKHHSYWCYGST